MSTRQRLRERLRQTGVAKRLILGGSAVILVLMTLLPLVFLVWTSLWSGYPGQLTGSFTLSNFIDVYLRDAFDVIELVTNSVTVAVLMTLVSLFFGGLFAWTLVRTNVPTKWAMELVVIAPLAIPAYIYAIMYIATFGPGQGVVTTMLGLESLPIDVFSPLGIGFVVGINQAPTAYLFIVPAIQDMDPSFEEVARIHGAGIFGTIRSISLPVILPAVLSAALISFLYGLGEFSVVAILGAPENFDVISTAIWTAVRGRVPPMYGASAALACSFLLATFVLVWYYRRVTERTESFMTVTGKGYQPRTWDLGKWRWPVATVLWTMLAVIWILPVLVMVLVSTQPVWSGGIDLATLTAAHYIEAILNPNLRQAFVNSVIVSLAAASLGTILSVGVAYYTERSDGRYRGLVDFLSLTPIAVPGIIIGVSLLFAALWVGRIHQAINIYGSLWLIVIGVVVVFIPVSSRIAIGNIVQIHSELEESARIFGASWLTQMREIFLPLFRNTTAVIWFFLLVHTFQVITVPIMTYAPDTRIIPVELFNIYLNSADIELVAAISTMFVAFFLVVVVLLRLSGITFYELRRS